MFDLTGLGNAMVDVTAPEAVTGGDWKDRMRQNRGGFFHTSEQEFNEICRQIGRGESLSAGGSVCNSIKAAAVCGVSAAFIGKIGQDDFGQYFAAKLEEYGIYDAMSRDPLLGTGCSVVLVDESGEKTICAKRRACKTLTMRDINWDVLLNSRMIFMEGYWLDGNPDLFRDVIEAAHAAGVRVAVTLSDPQMICKNGILHKILSKVDILLGNENEFAALAPESSELPALAVKTCGAEGVMLAENSAWRHFPPVSIRHLVNTTGAGDAFAGGFLAAFLQQRGANKAVENGQRCAAEVLARAESHISRQFKI